MYGGDLLLCKEEGYRSTKKFTASEKLKVFLQAIPCLFMIVVVIGGIISGIFTATEGSVVAVVYSLVLSVFFTSPSSPLNCRRFSLTARR